jgi:hypothetical protein
MEALPRNHGTQQERYPSHADRHGECSSKAVEIREHDARQHRRREDSPQIRGTSPHDKERVDGRGVHGQAGDKSIDET